jgi:cyanophycinase
MDRTLIAIGGAIRLSGAALQVFYRLSGAENGRICILPTASSREESGLEYVDALNQFGLKHKAVLLPVRQRLDGENTEFLEAVRGASGIFLTGGNSLRLTSAIGGTALHQELLDAYQRGAVIAGSSAGSAALSTLLIERGNSGSHPRHHIASFVPGLGFIASIIFDQHFRQRNRMGRLLYALASNPALLCVGIDEDTAAVIRSGVLKVCGSGAVTILDGSGLVHSNIAELSGSQLAAVSGVRLHILTHGCSFHLEKRCAQIPEKHPEEK